MGVLTCAVVFSPPEPRRRFRRFWRKGLFPSRQARAAGPAITGRSMHYLENCRKPVLGVVKSQAQAASCETFPRHGATRIANIPICARTAIDQNNPVYFFDFAQSPNIIRVNLLRFDFSPAPGACGISPEGEEDINGNSNAAFRPAKPVTFLGPPLG